MMKISCLKSSVFDDESELIMVTAAPRSMIASKLSSILVL